MLICPPKRRFKPGLSHLKWTKVNLLLWLVLEQKNCSGSNYHALLHHLLSTEHYTFQCREERPTYPVLRLIVTEDHDNSLPINLLQVEGGKGRKSKEQLEAEKRAILKQRVKSLEIDGFDAGKLSEKAKELHALIYRLEGEKYDLEKRFKAQQIDVSTSLFIEQQSIV